MGSTFTLLVGILPPSTLRIFEGGPVKKYTLCVCLKKHSITNRNIICFKKITLIQILLGLKNHPNRNTNMKKIHPNTNTNIIQFEKITRIQIRILFGLKKSPEYGYEYFGIRILFELYSNTELFAHLCFPLLSNRSLET